jgi:2'-5' RNA ligase
MDGFEWQKAYVHGVVLIWPSNDVRAQINPIRARYDPVSQSYCEAHISLTPPLLHVPVEGDWQLIEQAAACFAPFDINFGPVNSFGLSVIYLEVHPADRLAELRDALLATRLFANSDLNFVPHLTLTEGLSDMPVSQRLLDELQRAVPAGSFRCNHLVHIRPDQNFHFTVQRRIEFGKNLEQ